MTNFVGHSNLTPEEFKALADKLYNEAKVAEAQMRLRDAQIDLTSAKIFANQAIRQAKRQIEEAAIALQKAQENQLTSSASK